MNVGLIISSIALCISLMVFAIKLVEWLILADPRVVTRMGRWLLFFLAIASVPSLILLLVYQQWALAMTLGAVMLIVPTVLNSRAIVPRQSFRPMWAEGDPLDICPAISVNRRAQSSCAAPPSCWRTIWLMPAIRRSLRGLTAISAR